VSAALSFAAGAPGAAASLAAEPVPELPALPVPVAELPCPLGCPPPELLGHAIAPEASAAANAACSHHLPFLIMIPSGLSFTEGT